MEIDPDFAEAGNGDGEVDGDVALAENPLRLGNQTSPGVGEKEVDQTEQNYIPFWFFSLMYFHFFSFFM